jgi:hypothetical protein
MYFEQPLVEDRMEVWNGNIAIDSLCARTVFQIKDSVYLAIQKVLSPDSIEFAGN